MQVLELPILDLNQLLEPLVFRGETLYSGVGDIVLFTPLQVGDPSISVLNIPIGLLNLALVFCHLGPNHSTLLSQLNVLCQFGLQNVVEPLNFARQPGQLVSDLLVLDPEVPVVPRAVEVRVGGGGRDLQEGPIALLQLAVFYVEPVYLCDESVVLLLLPPQTAIQVLDLPVESRVLVLAFCQLPLHLCSQVLGCRQVVLFDMERSL